MNRRTEGQMERRTDEGHFYDPPSASRRGINKPKNDIFLYRHFKRTEHSLNDITIQSVEKNNYDINCTSRFKIMKRHETELKRRNPLKTPFPLGFNHNIYHEGNIYKMPDFDILECRKRKTGPQGVWKKTVTINVTYAQLKEIILR